MLIARDAPKAHRAPSFFKKIFIYYVAVLGLSCGTWDLPCVMGIFHYSTWILYLRCKGSVVIAHRLSCSVACGILVP